ncbi:MAG: hypothetical protein KDI92_14290 [Xanthomonadales bacterium]|nr:hypothetical protein [Xanthomonadales bacterium]
MNNRIKENNHTSNQLLTFQHKSRQTKPVYQHPFKHFIAAMVYGLILTFPVHSNASLEKDLTHITAILSNYELKASNDIVTVGTDRYCDFQSIQKAVESDADEIRIATEVYFENIFIINKSIQLLGGYKNCSDASNNISDGTQAVIDGDNYYSSAVTIINENDRQDVKLSHLIIGGSRQGLYTFNSDLNIFIEQVVFSHNSGSGMLLMGGNTKVYMKDSAIMWNNNHGISCFGPDESLGYDYGGKPDDQDMVIVMDGVEIAHNSVTSGSGGAGKIESGCRLNIFSPASISDNLASTLGGAFIVKQGLSSVGSELNLYGGKYCISGRCFGQSNEAISVKKNGVDPGFQFAAGGAISLQSKSILSAFNVNFKNNVANLGGAISSNLSQVNISNSSFTHNRANSGVVIDLHGGQVDIEGSYFTDNGANNFSYEDKHLFRVKYGTLNLKFSTIANNHTQGNILNNEYTGEVAVVATVIADTGPINFHWLDDTLYYCVLVHELDSFPGDTQTVILDDPMFVNPEAGDYHIQSNSPAVDFCNGIVTPQYSDRDGDQRNQDLPLTTNLYGAFDIGADEVPLKGISNK